jgi:hypothetical protein
MRKIAMVVMNASISGPIYWRKLAPSMMTATIRGKNPTGNWSWAGIHEMSPLMRAWEIPAMMKSPTPDPIPHLVTTSSMNMISTPPIQIWMKMMNETAKRLPPKNISAIN